MPDVEVLSYKVGAIKPETVIYAHALGEDTGRETRRNPVNERLKDVLNKPREDLEIEDERDQEKDQEVEEDRDIDRGPTHGV